MGLTTLLATNRTLIELLYALLVIIPSLWVFARTWRVYRFSHRESVKWFSLSFAAFAVAFAVRYAAMLYLINKGADPLATVSEVILPFFAMEFFAALPGFLLVYSLTRKEVGHVRPWIIITLAGIIAAADIATQSFLFLYASQVILMSVGTYVAFQRYHQRPSLFRRALSWTMTVLLVVWIANAIGQYAIDGLPWLRVPVYALTVIGVWSFLLIVSGLLRRAT